MSHNTMRSLVLVAAPLALMACNIGRQPVATMYAKSQVVGPAGGTITVTAADDPALAGTSITVPAGALTQSILITIAPSTQAVAQSDSDPAGPVVDFEPSGQKFAVAATITIPVTPPAGATLADMSIVAVEASGLVTLIAPSSLSGGLATFSTSGFTRFGGEHRHHPPPADGGSGCNTNSDCPTGSYCAGDGCGTPGTCTPLPQLCPADCAQPELCACDGRTYCNSCLIAAAGTRETACNPVGCTADGDCPPCDVCDSSGVCVEVAQCQTPDAGVCACFDADGNCIEDPSQCGMAIDAGPAPCLTDSDCPFCSLCINGTCEDVADCAPLDAGVCACFDSAGNCITDPTVCEGPGDGGPVTCGCPAIPADACTVTGPGPCYCPEVVDCDGGSGAADAGVVECLCPDVPSGTCAETGPAPCYCPIEVACDGGTGPEDGGIACPCAYFPPGTCTATGPGPCYCPEEVDCGAADGGACVSGAGAHCGGNIANPCTCADGLTCTPLDGGGPSGDVGGVCE
jgi:hypothetical protein